MAGMGPPPKPASQRRRTNATVPMTHLPAEGYKGPIPDWPLHEADAAELERWERVWRLPVAALWSRMQIELVVARYVRAALIVENDSRTMAKVQLNAEVRQLEDRLGLTPLAMLRLRWEIAPDELGDQRSENQAASAARRRIKAVDPDAVAGG